jgi:hypothetical protein
MPLAKQSVRGLPARGILETWWSAGFSELDAMNSVSVHKVS